MNLGVAYSDQGEARQTRRRAIQVGMRIMARAIAVLSGSTAICRAPLPTSAMRSPRSGARSRAMLFGPYRPELHYMRGPGPNGTPSTATACRAESPFAFRIDGPNPGAARRPPGASSDKGRAHDPRPQSSTTTRMSRCPWPTGRRSRSDVEIKVFNRAPRRAATRSIKALQGFDVVVGMRERTPFPRAVIETLPDLKLLDHHRRAQRLDRPEGRGRARRHRLRHRLASARRPPASPSA